MDARRDALANTERDDSHPLTRGTYNEGMITLLLALLLVVPTAGQASTQKKAAPAAKAPAEKVTVYRSRTCGCCGKWVQHMRDNGFDVTEHVVEDVNNAPNRDRVPQKLQSCHIATVRSYVVEGHVPADVVKDLLAKRPQIEGIAVPGMPAGSPGMESPNPEPYEVIAFTKDKSWVFAKR